MDAEAIITALGGPGKLSLILGLGQSAVSNWKSEGIPRSRCVQLAALADVLGRGDITAEVITRSRTDGALAA